ncbi:DUF4136 domain-containing protein [Pontibacter ruber]|uniref:DUF4136 domain-containing protein n=1 Tax=Pontibacter ruber TaxID=1343895 RepID=A0ABW5CT35_9BACT|nr:DUF4136 domain-containing protein [Pontibacter ruber]
MKQAFYPNFLLFILTSVLFSSCVSSSAVLKSNAISAPGTNVRSYQTFGWYQEKPQAPQAFDKGFNPNTDKYIRQAVEEDLERKGLRKVTENPDVLLAYDISVSVPAEKDRPELYTDGFGYSYAHMAGYRYRYGDGGLASYRPVDLFKQGTLIIDMIDPKSNELVWRGWREGIFTNFNAGYKKVSSYVQDILEKYPSHHALSK